ncbi:MAG: BamA/TamA family outer membrane protein [Rhodothermales bacterium]
MKPRSFLATLFVVVTLQLSMNAAGQDRPLVSAPDASQFQTERTVIEDLMTSLVGLVREVATDASASGITDRLREMTGRLTTLTSTGSPIESTSVTETPNATSIPLRANDLDQVEHLLKDIADRLVDLRHELHVDGKLQQAKRTEEIESQVLDALTIVNRLQRESDTQYSMRAEVAQDRGRQSGGYYRPGQYGDRNDSRKDDNPSWDRHDSDDDVYADDPNDDDAYNDRRHSWNWNSRESRRSNRRYTSGNKSPFATYVGEFHYGWPFRETGIYRNTPAIRYTRVDGLVLGIRKLPLAWDSWERGTIYGHVGYATASKRPQFEVGAEARPIEQNKSQLGFKLGGSYRRATATEDLWKTGWFENSLAAGLFNYDFFDYYETEGFTGYGMLRLTPMLQVTGGFRSEKYRTLDRETTWSLFGGSHFTANPGVVEGLMNTALVVVEGGAVSDYEWLPRGFAFRAEGEIGQGVGGDFDFNRAVAEGRAYLPAGRDGTLALRLRGGVGQGTIPAQKLFTIGGIGSVRGYSQNAFAGRRMLVGSAEYSVRQDWLWDDFVIGAFVDGGWLSTPSSKSFRMSDVFPSAGLSLGLMDQSLRLELAWPLDEDRTSSTAPSLWLRLSPSF